MEQQDDEQPRVVIEFEGEKATFWLTPSLTFAQLRSDACFLFGLAPSRAVLCDPIGGAYWPSSGTVLEAQKAHGGKKLRLQLQTKDHNLAASTSTLEASGSAPGSPGQDRPQKAPVRLSFFADEREQSSELLRSGSIRMPRFVGVKSTKLSWDKPPKSVLLVLKPGVESIIGYAATVGHWLQNRKLTVIVQDNSNEQLKDFSSLPKLRDSESLATLVDFVVTLGGDGTVLHAASLFSAAVPPIISFNLGSLGFLTRQQLPNFRPDIQALISGDMFLVLRARLCCKLLKKGPSGYYVSAEHHVLNEIVIDKAGSSNLTNLDCYCDGTYVTTVQGDGVIVCTPTGSTAYSLACGGTMIHPSVPCIGFTPISPHSLSFRPIIFPARAELRITNSKLARAPAYLAFDGTRQYELSGDDVISITTSTWPVPTVTSSDDISSWFASLADCLHWNDRGIQASNESHTNISISNL